MKKSQLRFIFPDLLANEHPGINKPGIFDFTQIYNESIAIITKNHGFKDSER